MGWHRASLSVLATPVPPPSWHRTQTPLPVVLDVLVHLAEPHRVAQGHVVGAGLHGGAPVHVCAEGTGQQRGQTPRGGHTGLSPEPPRTRLLVEDVAQEEDDDAEGDEGCPPGQQEHDDHRDGGAEERGPLAVIPKGGSPACTQTQTAAAAGCPHPTAGMEPGPGRGPPGELVTEEWKQLKLMRA